jgi:hypothetical protein
MTGSDFVTAKRKTTNAREYRGDVNVSLGDETVTFKHRLLTETEFMRLQQVLDTEALDEDDQPTNPEVGQTDEQQRLLELQQKEELSDEEEAELEELSGEVASQTAKIKDALGDEGFNLLMEMGQDVIKPSNEDVRHVYDLVSEDPSQAKELMGVSTLPSPTTEGVVREHLESELEEMIVDQPYPIKLNVGLQAMAETISVLGNGLQR